MALALKHATKLQLIARFRERFAEATRLDVWRMAALIRNLIDEGEVTALQVRTAFGLTVGQFAALSARIDGHRTKYYELKNATGE